MQLIKKPTGIRPERYAGTNDPNFPRQVVLHICYVLSSVPYLYIGYFLMRSKEKNGDFSKINEKKGVVLM